MVFGLGKYRKYGIKIKTHCPGGRYLHEVFDIGVKPDRVGEVSEKVVDSLKKVNELLWEEMPNGSKNLVSVIKYKDLKKKK